MRARTLWGLGGVLGFIAILAIGWFLIVSPMFGALATSERQRGDVELQNAALQTAISELQQVDVGGLESELRGLRRAVPGSVDEPGIISQVEAAASASGAVLASVTFQPPALFGVTPDASVALPIDPADVQAVSGAGMLVVQMSLAVIGDRAQVLAFADAIQRGERLYLVPSIAFGSSGEDGALSATVSAMTFVLPVPPGT